MRSRVLLLSVLLAFTSLSVAQATQPYGWTISASATDPYVNTAVPTFGVANYYLWLVCCDVPGYPDGTPRQQGFTAAKFALIEDGIVTLALNFAQPCLIIDGPTPPPPDILIACTGCPCGPVVVATLLVLDQPGSICFAPWVSTGEFVVADCENPVGLWGLDWIGLDTTGAEAPCSEGILCESTVAISGSSWGRVKGIYR